MIQPNRADNSSEDILTLHRLCRQADGGPKAVRWLNRRTGNWFALVDRAGTVLVGQPSGLGPGDVSAIRDGLAAMSERHLGAYRLSVGSVRDVQLIDVATTAARQTAPVLTIVGANPVPRALATDAAMLLGTWWSAEETRRARRRVDELETRNREAVLHLLRARQVSTAREIASVLCVPLPDPVLVHVIECDARARETVIRFRTRWAPPGAFIVPCPVRRRHVIVMAPADSGPLPSGALTGCTIGTSDVISLPETATGYEQAFDALTVARGLPDRRAKFHPGLVPAVLFEPEAAGWATALMTPLLDYRPMRGSDPGGEELIATLQSWLSFSTGATRHLKIHRNTLRTRLQHIESLLGLDLDRLDHQAAAALALRIRGRLRPPQTSERPEPISNPTLADLTRTTAMNQWARTILRPIRRSPNAAVLESTLRAWLDSNARLSTTAATLGLSVPGARKRIHRLEQLLERSLLHAPGTRHDLYLAIQAIDMSAAAAADVPSSEMRGVAPPSLPA